MQSWQHLIGEMQGNASLSELHKVTAINDFFNRICWVSDFTHWSREDYWATPVELLSSGGGDCEDFSIAKYFSLKALGITPDKLRITYVNGRGQAHMVLFYYPDSTANPLVLDNIDKRLVPLSKRKDLTPIYSFNSDSLRLEANPGHSPSPGDISSLKPWVSVLNRVNEQLPPGSPAAI